VTRSGTPVRTARFMAARVLALVEHPARDNTGPASKQPNRVEPHGPTPDGATSDW